MRTIFANSQVLAMTAKMFLSWQRWLVPSSRCQLCHWGTFLLIPKSWQRWQKCFPTSKDDRNPVPEASFSLNIYLHSKLLLREESCQCGRQRKNATSAFPCHAFPSSPSSFVISRIDLQWVIRVPQREEGDIEVAKSTLKYWGCVNTVCRALCKHLQMPPLKKVAELRLPNRLPAKARVSLTVEDCCVRLTNW